MGLTVLDDTGAVRPAPERGGKPSAWAQDVTSLAALMPPGGRGTVEHVFSQLQRIATWNEHGPVLGKTGRAVLEQLDLELPEIVETAPSSDGATRVVMKTGDGHLIEAVHMPRPHVKHPRTTFCVSSQVGCAMGCTFCATGTMGIVRNLSAGEIVGEVLALMRRFGPDRGHELNLVFMGMGEPLHNLDNVARAVEIMCDPRGIGLSAKRITVSTSGLVPRIESFAKLAVRPLLSVSINATTDETRSRVMPVNRAFNLARLKQTLVAYPFRPGEKVLLAYVLLQGENDTDDDAARLADFAAGLPANVNLIPLNEHALTTHKAPDDAWIASFSARVYDELKARDFGGVLTTRNNRGRDIRGACGQLVQGA
ncbi:MAG TPA: 23S rRNA (adenine(2503)-C(2))-methyltransferase RlmN [Myxococcota bacterium]